MSDNEDVKIMIVDIDVHNSTRESDSRGNYIPKQFSRNATLMDIYKSLQECRNRCIDHVDIRGSGDRVIRNVNPITTTVECMIGQGCGMVVFNLSNKRRRDDFPLFKDDVKENIKMNCICNSYRDSMSNPSPPPSSPSTINTSSVPLNHEIREDNNNNNNNRLRSVSITSNSNGIPCPVVDISNDSNDNDSTSQLILNDVQHSVHENNATLESPTRSVTNRLEYISLDPSQVPPPVPQDSLRNTIDEIENETRNNNSNTVREDGINNTNGTSSDEEIESIFNDGKGAAFDNS